MRKYWQRGSSRQGDMALGGPFFSKFLLITIYAVATRMIDGLSEHERRAQGDLFTKMATDLLSVELQGPSKITTIRQYDRRLV